MSGLGSILTTSMLAVVLAVPPTSHRYSFSTFREEADGLSVFADGYPASVGAHDAYVPIPIAIALMKSGKSVAFTPESFTLIDAKGNRFPAAGFTEIRDAYPKLEHDLSLTRARPIVVGTAIVERPRIASNFYPSPEWGTRIPRVELAPFSWFSDVLYFPRPPAGISGVMTLAVNVPGHDPIEVRLLMESAALAKR